MGKYHSRIKISSSPCLLNGSHSPANCFEAWPVNPQRDLALAIELAWSSRIISLINLWERNMSFHPPPSPFLPQSVTVFSLHFLPHKKKISASFISLSNRKKNNVTKIVRIRIMSQDLIQWAIGILSKPAVSKYAYSEMIISRGEDPKWQIPCLTSPTQNLRNQGVAYQWGQSV